MKKILLLVTIVVTIVAFPSRSCAQGGEWTWVPAKAASTEEKRSQQDRIEQKLDELEALMRIGFAETHERLARHGDAIADLDRRVTALEGGKRYYPPVPLWPVPQYQYQWYCWATPCEVVWGWAWVRVQ